MKKRLGLFIAMLLMMVSTETFAGGLLTNTNQHVSYLRSIARGASTEIDAAYFNPAGLTLMKEGFHFSFNGQSIFQTRTINSTFGNEQFLGFGGFGEKQTKEYKGEAAVPLLPSLYGVYRRGNWAFSAHFAMTGGGGKATFNNGLGSFESLVAAHMEGLYKKIPGTSNYSLDSFMEGKQLIFGLQMGAAYKINDNFSAYGGIRMNYVNNGYYGYIRNISANLGGGKMVALNPYFTEVAAQYEAGAVLAEAAGDSEKATELRAQAAAATQVAKSSEDIELDSSQSGWGVTPILGVNFNWKKLNVGVKYEFNTRLNVENKTKGKGLGAQLFPDGVNTPHDIPSLLSVGASYQLIPTVKAAVSYHHFFDTHAKMANNRQNHINKGTNEYMAGIEWDVCDWAQISTGIQRTVYDVSDDYQNDMSFAVSSNSYGVGAGFMLAKNLKLNVAYFWTNYGSYTKESTNYNGTGLPGSDVYTRKNKVFGVGLDYSF